MEYEEHEKRAWSVDFSQTEPSRLMSGSDDCKVNHISLLVSVSYNVLLFWWISWISFRQHGHAKTCK